MENHDLKNIDSNEGNIRGTCLRPRSMPLGTFPPVAELADREEEARAQAGKLVAHFILVPHAIFESLPQFRLDEPFEVPTSDVDRCGAVFIFCWTGGLNASVEITALRQHEKLLIVFSDFSKGEETL